jgi:D-ribose pyranase
VLITGILNPAINSLISRVRHTNTLVIADRGFPFFSEIETVDIALIDDIPRILDVLPALRANFKVGTVFMAEEFKIHNTPQTIQTFEDALHDLQIVYEHHIHLKRRVPHALGLIRTADTTLYSNMILESA